MRCIFSKASELRQTCVKTRIDPSQLTALDALKSQKPNELTFALKIGQDKFINFGMFFSHYGRIYKFASSD